MNLKKKKKLAARVLKVGAGRIVLSSDMPEEIKEAITRQDIRDLVKEKIIKIKEKKGRRKIRKRKTKKRGGKVKKKVNKRKREYVKLTRKLRKYVKNLKLKGRITREEYYNLRKKIRAKSFRDLTHLRTIIGGKR